MSVFDTGCEACDGDGKVWNNADPTSGQFVACEVCQGHGGVNAQHTPGPWLSHAGMLGYRGDIFSPTAKAITDCHHIARCFAPKPTKPVICDLQAIGATHDAIAIIEANTRLIAAAPDLLEALQEVMGWIANWSPDFTQDDEWAATSAKVAAAQAKASTHE